MWTIIEQLIQGVVTGVVGPLFTWLNKKQDVSLEGFKAAATVDQAIEINRVQAELANNKIRAGLMGSPVFQTVNWIVGPVSAVYYALIVIDTIQGAFSGRFWAIPKLPAPFDAQLLVFLSSYIIAQTAQHGLTTFADAWRSRK